MRWCVWALVVSSVDTVGCMCACSLCECASRIRALQLRISCVPVPTCVCSITIMSECECARLCERVCQSVEKHVFVWVHLKWCSSLEPSREKKRQIDFFLSHSQNPSVNAQMLPQHYGCCCWFWYYWLLLCYTGGGATAAIHTLCCVCVHMRKVAKFQRQISLKRSYFCASHSFNVRRWEQSMETHLQIYLSVCMGLHVYPYSSHIGIKQPLNVSQQELFISFANHTHTYKHRWTHGHTTTHVANGRVEAFSWPTKHSYRMCESNGISFYWIP